MHRSEKARSGERGAFNGTLAFILICIAIAVVLSAIIILFIREVFAISTPPDTDANVTVELESDVGVSELADVLKKNGLINSRALFSVYSVVRGKTREFAAGKYVLSPTLGYSGLLRAVSGGNAVKRKQISVTIPEGSTVREVVRIICEEAKICSEQELIDAIQNGEYGDHTAVRELSGKISADREYRLEGYLYPDTYYFYTDSSAYTVIGRMLSNFDRHFDKRYRDACEKLGFTVDDAVILASIVMKEAKFVSDYPKISSVFHNRLGSSHFKGMLQSDATLTYALGRPMSAEDKELDNAYNTYKHAGLPPSPICSPDINAISYALCPDKTDYYYFVSAASGKIYYATTYEAHKRNIARASAKS